MGIIQVNPGSPLTVGGGSGNKISGFQAITTSPALVLPANPSRQSVTFHNPGTVDIYVAPTTLITNGSQSNFAPSPSILGGTFLIYANGGSLTVTGECQCGWQAFAATGSTNFLTVMESNV